MFIVICNSIDPPQFRSTTRAKQFVLAEVIHAAIDKLRIKQDGFASFWNDLQLLKGFRILPSRKIGTVNPFPSLLQTQNSATMRCA
jgi:hypothetical protein